MENKTTKLKEGGRAMVKPKKVYHISDRDGERAVWTTIGRAYVNKDGSLNVVLNTIPADGRIHIRGPKKGV